MLTLSFVLEDWAIYELVESPKHRKSSCYACGLFICYLDISDPYIFKIDRDVGSSMESGLDTKNRRSQETHSSVLPCGILAFVVIFGIFNRITFPAFLFIPGLRLLPHFKRKPLSLISMILFGGLATFIAICLDTNFYANGPVTWSHLFAHPTITPFNNLNYNLATENLALHGLHPWYQHSLINLPQLLGPATLLVFLQPLASLRLYSAISGIVITKQNTELPCVSGGGLWIAFNLLLGLLMGVYHQGGVVPTQVFLSKQLDATHAIWWKNIQSTNLAPERQK
ncbi:hypothetical protein EYC84_003135 [Monilinia fructicola]|uniref:Mannosyltransferase n=1 Tax=Monilinia fructicola TaxID=38448 RepID=A0A5M9K0V1_MONFR|nr:hypothetical protein EYC84_003135 [Monilinia fructicola]